MEYSSFTIIGITLKHQHKWGCPVYVLDDRLQNSNITGLPKWDTHAHVVIYLGHAYFHASSLNLVLKP